MTKFEEELFYKVPCKFEITTEAEYKKSTLINHFKNWHSDEEFQELFDNYEKEVIKSSKLETSNLKLIAEGTGLLSDNAMLTKKVEDLKSQLQQQALPVVPECVAGAIESLPEHYSAFEAISLINAKVNALPEENEDWLPVYNWLCEGIGNQNIFALAFITGKYEVEKPQLFYLKNKLTGDCLAICLARASSGLYVEVTEKWLTRKEQASYKLYFTQQEIDNMEIGSYKQIEVVK